jgi:hypothetical protein
MGSVREPSAAVRIADDRNEKTLAGTFLTPSFIPERPSGLPEPAPGPARTHRTVWRWPHDPGTGLSRSRGRRKRERRYPGGLRKSAEYRSRTAPDALPVRCYRRS